MQFSFKTVLAGAMLVFSLAGAAEASPKILYVPLDNRPVCLEYTGDTAKAAVIPDGPRKKIFQPEEPRQ